MPDQFPLKIHPNRRVRGSFTRESKASSNPLGNLDNLAATDFVSASYDKVPFHSGELG
jgi:hypothetical protein